MHDVHGVADATLGGYLSVHERPPAFEGPDGHPYTVSVEVEKVGSLRAPYRGYLVFPRWAETGVGIVGHVETEPLDVATTELAARTGVEALPLDEVKRLLDVAIARETRDASGDGREGVDDAP